MKRQQGYKYRLNLPDGAATRLSQYAGCARLVWNMAMVASETKYPGNGHLSALLPSWKASLPFLKDCDSIALQQSLRNFDQAWRNYFKFPEHFDRPTFKKRDFHSSFRIAGTAAQKTEQGRVWLPKFGWLSYRQSRKWEGSVTSLTFRRKAGKWYVTVGTKREVAEPTPRKGNWVGIDVGIARYATLSTGAHAPSVHALKKSQHKLTKQSRILEKCQKGGRRRAKIKLRVQALHQRVANQRADHAHQVSSLIVKKHGRVKMEDLRLVNMMKSAKGTDESPGKNVAQKRGLNRHLADQGLRQLRTFIEYKVAWSGGCFVAVDPRYTSQRCHACKHLARENRVTQADFACVACGHTDHADVNAAKNIRDSAVGDIAVKATPRRRRKGPAKDVRILGAA